MRPVDMNTTIHPITSQITQTQITTHNGNTHSAVATDNKDCLVVLKMEKSLKK